MPKNQTRKARFQRASRSKATASQPEIRPHCAGIDVGSNEIHVAAPADSDPKPVRSFGVFTEDLEALAQWLQGCGVLSVAMESTGVYWIPLFQILEKQGMEVCLVNARHVKNVPGRKSDVSDCQWLQQLHSFGLLQASLRPPAQVCAVRSIWRHRDMLVRTAASHVQHMQKALTQMNLRLPQVLSDLTGQTGLAIVDAIIAGERDPQKLAELRNFRVRSTKAEIAKSLVGTWDPEHLFVLQQVRSLYATYQQRIAECDLEIEKLLQGFASQIDPETTPLPPRTRSHAKPRRNEVSFDLRAELHRILGVDLTQVPGLQGITASVFLSEVGPSVARFRTAKHFASWLGLCPDNRITGGRVLSAATRKVRSRTAHALRMAAQCLHHSKSSLGDYFRRQKARLGAPSAITATAHKLARIIHYLISNRCAYDESVFAREDALNQIRQERSLQKRAEKMGYKLVPATE